jgi:hypothetical protein
LSPSGAFPYSLLSQLEGVKDRSLPPVHSWHPEASRDIDMCIKHDGSWHYMGSPIERIRMVRLFASILRRDGDDYFLVTPVEKCRIVVEDVPFQGVLLENQGIGEEQSLTIITNTGDRVLVGKAYPIEFSKGQHSDNPHLPYVLVRQGLSARLNRNVYYQLMELVSERLFNGALWHGVWSENHFSQLMRV